MIAWARFASELVKLVTPHSACDSEPSQLRAVGNGLGEEEVRGWQPGPMCSQAGLNALLCTPEKFALLLLRERDGAEHCGGAGGVAVTTMAAGRERGA